MSEKVRKWIPASLAAGEVSAIMRLLKAAKKTGSELMPRIIPYLVSVVIVTSHLYHTCLGRDADCFNQQACCLGQVDHTGKKLIPIEMAGPGDHEYCAVCLLLAREPNPMRTGLGSFHCTNSNVEYVFLEPFDPTLIKHPRGPPLHS